MKKQLQLFILFSFISTIFGMYEEQLGSYDWHQQHIGLVNNAVFNNKGIRAFVSTEQGSLSAIYLKDGSITWRKIVDQDVKSIKSKESGILRAFEASQRSVVAHVGGNCEQVWVWDMQVGGLLFNSRLQSNGCDGADVSWVGSRGYLATLGDGVLSLLRGKDGSLLWQTDELFQPGEFNVARIHSSEQTITLLLAKIGSSSLKKIEVGASDGETADSKTISLSEQIGNQQDLSSSSFVYVSQSQDKVCAVSATDGGFQGCVGISKGENVQLKCSEEVAEFAIQVTGSEENYVQIFGVEQGQIKSIVKYGFDTQIFSSLGIWRGSDELTGYLSIVKQNAGFLIYDIIQTSNGQAIKSDQKIDVSSVSDSYGHIPDLKETYFASFKSKSGSVGVRLVCVFWDWSLAFVQQDSLVWKRDEALAGITEAKFVPLPPPTKELEKQYRQNALGLESQLKAQFIAIKKGFNLAQPGEVEELESLRQQLSDKRLPWRDTNGFRKLIIAPTLSGKLVALHNGNGNTLWSVDFGPGRAPSHVEIWRNSHDPAQDILVMLILPPTTAGSTLVLLDAYDGSEVWKEDLEYKVEFVLPMKQNLILGKLEQNLFLLIERDSSSNQLTAYVHPRQEDAAVIMNKFVPDTFFWSVDQHKNEVQGFGFTCNPAAVSLTYNVVQTWKMVFPSNLLAVVGKQIGSQPDPLYSQVKILGDRSLLFKYHNDNLIMVVSGVGDGAATSVMDASEVVLSVTFIDSVSGKIVYRQDHPGARGPVKAVLSEHWAVYHYWSVLNEGWQLTVVELYEDVYRPIDLLDLLLGKNVITYNDTYSSFDQPPVKALTQTYFTTLPVKSLAVTQTLAGLSVKNILMASYGDQIYAMDKRLLDPRRPKLEPGQKLSTEQQAEGLRPYSAYLPLASTSYATYNERVSGVRGMVTAPSGLESTSLLFAYGMDLFYTRLMPSKGFDSLDEYFSYALLVLAMVGLLAGAVLARWMHNSNKLKQKWK